MKLVRRLPEYILIALVMASMFYTCVEYLGMRWLAQPLLRLFDLLG